MPRKSSVNETVRNVSFVFNRIEGDWNNNDGLLPRKRNVAHGKNRNEDHERKLSVVHGKRN
jgi:hypothetical protein